MFPICYWLLEARLGTFDVCATCAALSHSQSHELGLGRKRHSNTAYAACRTTKRKERTLTVYVQSNTKPTRSEDGGAVQSRRDSQRRISARSCNKSRQKTRQPMNCSLSLPNALTRLFRRNSVAPTASQAPPYAQQRTAGQHEIGAESRVSCVGA